jgi:hypothetical protein
VSIPTLDKIKKSVVFTLESVVLTLKKTHLSVEMTLAKALFMCGSK